MVNLVNLYFRDLYSVLKLKPVCHNLLLWTKCSR